MKAGIKSPDKLTSYIQRAFAKCINAADRQFMEAILKKICNSQKAPNILYTRDWDSLPLPTLPREGNKQYSLSLNDFKIFQAFLIFIFQVLNVNSLSIGPQYMANNLRLENPELSAQSLFFSGLNNTNSLNTQQVASLQSQPMTVAQQMMLNNAQKVNLKILNPMIVCQQWRHYQYAAIESAHQQRTQQYVHVGD